MCKNLCTFAGNLYSTLNTMHEEMLYNSQSILQLFPDMDYTEERECDYKGEHYSVRDNGAIMRHYKGRKRPSDNIWTFGRKDDSTGYMIFSGERVHRIVATAFLGEAPSEQHVVDHIDTNRCNNRPENLRWLTKLENILLNENTLAKVVYICGSVDAFLENPQLLYNHEQDDSNFFWMRSVTKEEAAATRENLKHLASRPKEAATKGEHVGDWIFKMRREDAYQPNFSKRDEEVAPSSNREQPIQKQTIQDLSLNNNKLLSEYGEGYGETDLSKLFAPVPEENRVKPEPELPEYFPTSNPLAVQRGWMPYSNPEFLCCPTSVSDEPLKDYLANLKEGNVFVKANYGESTIEEFTQYNDSILVITRVPNIKPFGLAKVSWTGEAFLHESKGTFFEENGVRAAYTRAQGLEWDGEESIDDYM